MQHRQPLHETLADPGTHGGGATSLMQAIGRMTSTRINGWIGLACDFAISAGLLYAGLRRNPDPFVAITAALAGLLVFTFVEYCFHRWLFHGRAQMFQRGHDRHHEEPTGYDALPFFLPPIGILLIAALLHRVAPFAVTCFAMGGFAVGYAAYGLSHTAMHDVRLRRVLPRRWASAHHVHHFHPETNFGVTSPLWDVLLRTRYVSQRQRTRGARPASRGDSVG